MKKIFDITIDVCETMPAFPGDEKIFVRQDILRVEKGDPYSIRKITMLTHTGTHIDAPSHFIPEGKNLEEVDLTTFIGPADVIEITDDESVKFDEIKKFPFEAGTIVLFKTKNSQLWKENKGFVANYVYVTPEVAKYLVDRKIKAVGIDYLSIDKYDDFSAPETHLILLGNNVPIIEGIDLSNVNPGRYKLFCLPLKMSGVDGSPVRAVLEEI